MIDEQRAAFEAWAKRTKRRGNFVLREGDGYADGYANSDWHVWQAALASPEVQALWDALEQCRFALEPYDDIKPRDWKSDRENLRRAHQTARAALAAMEKQRCGD